MPTPYGHAIAGYAIGRTLGLQRRGAGLSAFLATLPDIDIPIGWLRHRDLFALHRGFTHTLQFALLVGAATGIAQGIARRAKPDAAAPPLAAASLAAVASHVVLDLVDLPLVSKAPRLTHERVVSEIRAVFLWESAAVAVETALLGVPAWLLARRAARRHPPS